MNSMIWVLLLSVLFICTISDALGQTPTKAESESYVRSIKISNDGNLVTYLQSDHLNGDVVVIEVSQLSEIGVRETVRQVFGFSGVTHTSFFSDRTLDVSVIGPEPGVGRIFRFELDTGKFVPYSRFDDYLEIGGYGTPENDYNFSTTSFLHLSSKRAFQFDVGTGELVPDMGLGAASLCKLPNKAGSLVLIKDAKGMAWRIKAGEKSAPMTDVLWHLNGSTPRVHTHLVGLDRSACEVFLLTNSVSGTYELHKTDLTTGQTRLVFKEDGRDLVQPLISSNGDVDLVHVSTPKPRALGITEAVKAKLIQLNNLYSQGYWIEARSKNDQFWLVRHGDNLCQPVWSVVDTKAKAVIRTVRHPATNVNGLCIRDSSEFNGFEGVKIGTLFSRANSLTCKNTKCPLLLLIHGGPATEDSLKITRLIVESIRLGYAVLQVNYRGSTGRGLAYVNLDEKNWGTAIPNDLLSAIVNLEKKGYRFGARAAFGESFGGYLALVLATKYASLDCAASYAAPTNLEHFIRFTSSRGIDDLSRRIGNPNDASELKTIKNISPLSFASKGTTPLLLMHGLLDEIVPASETISFVETRAHHNKAVVGIVFDEGTHTLPATSNDKILPSALNTFLDKCRKLQLSKEPFSDSKFRQKNKIKYLDNLQILHEGR
jgi:dipeptidyl aminopeptidase/acylaminoacyl peptidase